MNDRKQTATNVPGRNRVETRNKSETSKLLFKTGIRITDEWIRTHLEKEKKKKKKKCGRHSVLAGTECNLK